MEQINRLRTEPVQIEISPGDREGWSVVTLTALPEWPVTGSVGIDNSGQKNTGTGAVKWCPFLLIILWGWLTTGLSAGTEQ